ncbi:MAG: DUF5686 and carboxypeptidase regulatory-like domain-containing protein [Paludibacter sp.]|nr:DUF5686 and carboxypeptidase regulatory-like domain-containing protein [Paludibacter sp.]
MKQILLILNILLSLNLFAHNFSGRVVDSDGNSVASASIFVKETRQGLITNEAGEFSIALNVGTYNLEISCVGFEKKQEKIIMPDNDYQKDIILIVNYIQLSEVVATAGEDPAYSIMRKAIAKAPFYQNVVKSSTYNAYSKGSGKMTSIPKLFTGMMSESDKKEMEQFRNKIFLLESYSEIKFTAPETYEQNIKAFSSSFPMMDDPTNSFISTMFSLYNPYFLSAISPLNKNAFNYYRFRYEGFEIVNNQTINKITIIPRLQDPQLLSGTLYIAEDQWNVRNADISISAMGINFTYHLNYHEVSNDIYLVTDALTEIDANILGVKFEANLLSSMQFTDIKLNDSLIAVEKSNVIPVKIKEKAKKKSLEIKEEDYIKKSVDSLATKRDSAYWNGVRKIVLTDEEQQSYVRRDTLEQYLDSVDRAERNPKFSMSDLIFGGRIGNDSSLFYFNYSGLLGTWDGYNFTDGFRLGQSFGFDFKNKKSHHLTINPSVFYMTARRDFVWNINTNINYFPKTLRGNANLNFGRKTEDYSREAGMGNLLNTAYTLFYGQNYAKLFDEKFITFSNALDIANGLRLQVQEEFARRNELNISTKYHLFGKKERWTPNVPDFAGELFPKFSDLAKYEIKLTYTPEYYYIIENGGKRYVRSRFPTFSLDFESGISFGNSNFASKQTASQFNRIEVGINQNIRTSIFSQINYNIIFGKFLNNNDFNYIDYKHFESGGGLWIATKNIQNSYALLPFYTFSTNNWYLQAFINYNSDYILLKRLPFLQGKMFNEGLHAKLLHTAAKPFYSEFGYSIGFSSMVNLGVFVAFDRVKYNSVGFQFCIPFVNVFGKKSNKGGVVTLGTDGINVEMY